MFNFGAKLLSVTAGFRDTAGFSPGERRRFLAEDRKETLRSARLLAVLAMVLVPLFSALDFYSHPELFKQFLILRAVCVLAVSVIIVSLRTKMFHRFYRLYAILIPMIPAICIGGMIFLIGEAGTPYYAGLTLCIVAVGFMFNWTYREALFCSASVMLIYLFSSLPSFSGELSLQSTAAFADNCLFILANGTVVTLGSLSNYRRRIREFKSRQEIRRQKTRLTAQNDELKDTLKELRETERQLIQSDKMASLGQLSAGVIHEIGNPLNFSNQALYVLRKKLQRSGTKEDYAEILSDLQDGFDRMKEIVSELREFSHSSSGANMTFPGEQCVSSALRMLAKEIEDSGVEIELNLNPGVLIAGVKNQITQVVMNLIQNAIQACEETDRKCRILINCEFAGEYHLLSVEDNGPGIHPDNSRKLFDPFFTTKDPGRGTGLGLSICYRIVEAHGGTIEVDSVPGKSSSFSILLPAFTNHRSSDIAFNLQN